MRSFLEHPDRSGAQKGEQDETIKSVGTDVIAGTVLYPSLPRVEELNLLRRWLRHGTYLQVCY